MTDDSLPMFVRRFADKHPYAFRYGSAVLISLAALVIVLILPFHRQQPVLLFFEAGVALATWIGGWRAGVVALIGGTIASAYFALNNFAGPPTVFRMVLNEFYTVGIIWVVEKLRLSQEALRLSQERFRRLNGELEQRVTERTAELQSTNQKLLKEIADRKQAEEALRRSKAYLAEAQRLTHTGSWALQEDAGEWVVRYWSDENFRIWGFDLQQGLPTTEMVQQRVHPEDRDKAIERVEKALRARTDYTTEFRIVLPDGSVRHILSLAHSVIKASEHYVEMIGTHVDVTERNRAEEERTRLEADLRHMNRLSMLGQLTASIAHELKQPIASSLNNAQTGLNWLDRQTPDLEEVRESLALVVNDALRAGEVIERIRDLVKKAPRRKDHLEINGAIREVIELTSRETTKNGVTVEMQLAESLPLIEGDRVQLQQVILNLINNAVQAMSGAGEGPRKLLVSTGKGESGDVLVVVGDSGPGLAPGAIERIFEPFHSTNPGGLGLGLSICRSILEAHDGRLWASANEPRGALFQFTLPARAGDAW